MIIVGDISGIQDYLFNISAVAGGQAKRLRARSFYLQTLSECAALRIRQAAGWDPESLVFCAAGKFVLSGNSLSSQAQEAVRSAEYSICNWLLTDVGAEIRMAVCMVDAAGSIRDQYTMAMQELDLRKAKSWQNVAVTTNGSGFSCWNEEILRLAPLDTPCVVCRSRKAIDTEVDKDTGESRGVCQRCKDDRLIGAELVLAKWMEIRSTPPENLANGHLFEMHGYFVWVHHNVQPNESHDVVAVYALGNNEPPASLRHKWIKRTLARYVPIARNGQHLDFGDIAEFSQGASYLGVLKMDVDNLGLAIEKCLENSPDLNPLSQLSSRLDTFFSTRVNTEIKQRFKNLYTIFSGGDDLLLVGPWNEALDCAREVQRLFHKEFVREGLTISAGLSIVKSRLPIGRGVQQADDLLYTAKHESQRYGADAKGQIATFGQCWVWSKHDEIIAIAKKLIKWESDDLIERGWLHTLLQLAEARENANRHNLAIPHDVRDRMRINELMSTSRLAYHVGRNYPRVTDSNREKVALRRWADSLIEDFDNPTKIDVRYLTAIARYALTATRSKEGGKHESEE